MIKRWMAFLMSFLIIATLCVGCGDKFSTKQKESHSSKSTSDMNNKEITEEKYTTPVLALTTDTWDIPVGENRTVTFTVTSGENLSTLPILYAGEKKVAEFTSDSDGVYTVTINLKSNIREMRYYQAVNGQNKSNKLSVSFYKTPTAEEKSENDKILDEIQAAYFSKAPEKNPTEKELAAAVTAVSKVLDQAVDDKIVRSYISTETGVAVTFSNGLLEILDLFSIEEVWSGSIESTPERKMIDKLEELMNDTVAIPITGGERRKIAVIQTAYGSGKRECNCNVMKNACEQIVKQYDNFELVVLREMTLELAANLDQYDIILWEGHGCHAANDGRDFPAMTFHQNLEEIIGTRFEEDFGSRLFQGAKDKTTIFLTPMFFDKYYRHGSLDGTLFYLGTCSSAASAETSFVNVLMDKGASAVLGYTNTVGFDYNHEMATSLFLELSKGKTAKQALATARSRHGDRDMSSSGMVVWLLYRDDKNKYIPKKEAAKLVLFEDETSYTVPTESKTRKLPGVLFLAGRNWKEISGYDWDSTSLYGYEDGWNVDCTLGTSLVSLWFDGKYDDPNAFPTSVRVDTMAGMINGYDEISFLGNLYNGMSWQELNLWVDVNRENASYVGVSLFLTELNENGESTLSVYNDQDIRLEIVFTFRGDGRYLASGQYILQN